MQVIVTGGTGFLGRPLIHALLGRGARVIVPSRDPDAARRALPGPVEVVAAAPPGHGLRDEVLADADAVIHLAAESLTRRWTRARRARIESSRVAGTRDLAAALARSPRRRVLLNASGVGIYGDRPGELVDEDAAPGAGWLAGITAGREQMADRAAVSGARVVHLRLGIVLHPSAGFLGKALRLRRLGLSGQLGAGRQGVSWIHRDDAVRLFLHALDHDHVSGPINAVAPEPVDNRTLAQALARHDAGRRGVRLPAWLVRAALGELGAMMLAGQSVTPRRALASGFRFQFSTLDAALAALLAAPPSALPRPETAPSREGRSW